MSFDPTVLLENTDAILAGIGNTMAISTLSTLIAIVLGLIVAVCRKTLILPLRFMFQAYVQFFRNTPLLVQVYFFYKGLPHLGLTLSPFTCGVLALSLQTGAYMAEIFRVGIESIPREQFESGLALGLNKLQTYMTIIFPQALGMIMPPLGNQIVGLIKNSSLVAFITVPDLFFVIYQGGATHFRYLEFFILGILLYMGLTLGVSWLFLQVENRITIIERVRQEHYV